MGHMTPLAPLALLASLCSALEVDWNSPRLAPPRDAAHPAIPGRAAREAATDGLRGKVLAAAQDPENADGLNPEHAFALPGAEFRRVRDAVFEADLDPGLRGFTRADLAVLADGRVVFYYSTFSADPRRLARSLEAADLFLREDSQGRPRFFQKGREVEAFDAYLALARESFLADAVPELGPEERVELRTLLAGKRLVPISLEPGSVKLFDDARGELIRAPLPRSAALPSYLDVRRALQSL